MNARDILTVQQFGRAVGRVLRAGLADRRDLWVSAQVWVPLTGGAVRPPVVVAAGAPPVDGCLTRLPLLVVRPAQPPVDPDAHAWAGAGVPCWEIGSSAVRIWSAEVGSGSRCDVRRPDDFLPLPDAAGMVHARELLAAGAAAQVRRLRRRVPCDWCLTPDTVVS